MSELDQKLDQRLREQLSDLHTAARTEHTTQSELGRDAQRRVVERMVLEAQWLERQRRRRTWVVSGAVVALLTAAAALLIVRPFAPQPAAAPRLETGTETEVAERAVPQEACALPVLPAPSGCLRSNIVWLTVPP